MIVLLISLIEVKKRGPIRPSKQDFEIYEGKISTLPAKSHSLVYKENVPRVKVL